MVLKPIDFTDYLDTRRRMRLLPNLFDFGIAYGIFRPIINFRAYLQPLVRHTDNSLPAWLYHHFTSDPVVFFGGVLIYAIFALAVAGFNGSFGVKLKTLVLSDSTVTIWIFFVFFSILLVFYLLNQFYFIALLPGIYVYACSRYLWLLHKLRRHQLYCHLIGVPRRIFSYSTERYDFKSRRALAIYLATFRSAGKLLLGYLGIGFYIVALVIVMQTIPNIESSPPTWLMLVIAFIAIVLISQPIAYARRFLANEWLEWTRKLRANLARSAKDQSYFDERPPILFLRSFRDDHIEVRSERYWGHAFLGLKNQQVRLEEVLAETLYEYGPLVALSNPRDALQPLGAARENVANENWQEEVGKNMEHAVWIILVVGSTPNLRWEIVQLLKLGYLHKTLLIFPPSYHDLANPDRLVVNTLPELATALHIETDEYERKVLNGVLVISCKDESNAMVIRQNGHGEARGYADAVRLAVASCAPETRVSNRPALNL